jgi:hypothetical protein
LIPRDALRVGVVADLHLQDANALERGTVGNCRARVGFRLRSCAIEVCGKSKTTGSLVRFLHADERAGDLDLRVSYQAASMVLEQEGLTCP